MKIFTILLLYLTIAGCCKFGNPGPVTVVAKPDTVADGGYIGITAINTNDTTHNRDEILLQYNHTTLSIYQPGSDARYFAGFGQLNLCSLSSDSIYLTVNTQPYKAGKPIDLRLNIKNAGQYYFRISQFSGIPASLKVWLKDTKLSDSLNLRTGNYNFTSSIITVADSTRFKIIIR